MRGVGYDERSNVRNGSRVGSIDAVIIAEYACSPIRPSVTMSSPKTIIHIFVRLRRAKRAAKEGTFVTIERT